MKEIKWWASGMLRCGGVGYSPIMIRVGSKVYQVEIETIKDKEVAKEINFWDAPRRDLYWGMKYWGKNIVTFKELKEIMKGDEKD